MTFFDDRVRAFRLYEEEGKKSGRKSPDCERLPDYDDWNSCRLNDITVHALEIATGRFYRRKKSLSWIATLRCVALSRTQTTVQTSSHVYPSVLYTVLSAHQRHQRCKSETVSCEMQG